MRRDDSQVRRDIEQYGWHVVLVLAQESEPAFAYTIGLYESFRHAEVIIFGLSLDLMHDILNVIGKAIRAGMVFASGTESSAILDGYHCAFRAVSAQWYPKYMGVALDYYSTTTFPVVQCFWPNKDGLYPWDERISAAWSRRQPVLAGAA